MFYVFWANLAVWALVSLYILLVERRIASTNSRLVSIEMKLRDKKEGEGDNG